MWLPRWRWKIHPARSNTRPLTTGNFAIGCLTGRYTVSNSTSVRTSPWSALSCSVSSHASMASRAFARASSRVEPWDQQPLSAGTRATKPESSPGVRMTFNFTNTSQFRCQLGLGDYTVGVLELPSDISEILIRCGNPFRHVENQGDGTPIELFLRFSSEINVFGFRV